MLQQTRRQVKTTARPLAAAVVLALATSGCAINRVATAKKQFCDFDSNFSYAIGERPYFTFELPVLIEKDFDAIIVY